MGSNSNNTAELQQGLYMASDLINRFGNTSKPSYVEDSKAYEEKAKMKELDARERAMQEKRQAKQAAQTTHAKQEFERSRKTANWGSSGVAASGSRSLVEEGYQTTDREVEDSILYEGDRRAGEIMDKGTRDANLFYINTDQKPRPTTLSLGSKLYDPRR